MAAAWRGGGVADAGASTQWMEWGGGGAVVMVRMVGVVRMVGWWVGGVVRWWGW